MARSALSAAHTDFDVLVCLCPFYSFASFHRRLLETPAQQELIYCPYVGNNAFVMRPWDKIRIYFARSKILGKLKVEAL